MLPNRLAGIAGTLRGPARRPVGQPLRWDAVSPAATSVEDWPGRRLGLPPSGPGSVARVGRRLLAVLLDWLACTLVARTLLSGGSWTTLIVFAAEQILLVGTLGAGFGHALLGLRVRRLDGSLPGPVPALVRALLLSLALPPLVYDLDQRGLHDRAAGTVLQRR